MKKCIAVIVVIWLFVFLFPLLAAAENVIAGGSYGYTTSWHLLDDGTLLVFGQRTGIIPDGNPWRSYSTSIRRVEFDENITAIGSNNFSGFPNLASVFIPDSVTAIGSNAFSHCSSLVSINIPDSVAAIGDSAFAGCTNLTGIHIPDSLASIGTSVFSGCNGLTSITVPAGVTGIGDDAFAGCGNLSRIEFLHSPEDHISFSDSTGIGTDAVIYCYAGSAAESWFSEKGNTVILLDELDPDSIRTVSLPDDFRLLFGYSQSLNCSVFPDFDHPDVTWSSSNPSVVPVESDGTVTALYYGTAVITASVGDASDSITVHAYIPAQSFELSPPEEWVVIRDTLQINITEILPEHAEAYATWESSNNTYASVDPSGLAIAKKATNTPITITATNENGVKSTCKLHICNSVTAIELDAAMDEIIPGMDLQLTANVTMGTQTCINHLVSYTSSDPETASVDSSGLVHALKPGTVTITAFAASGASDTFTITIPDKCEIVDGEMIDHLWGDPEYTWNDVNTSVTASRICQRHAEHVQSETVSVTPQETKPASCLEPGETTYTGAEFINEAFEAQSRTLADIPAIGHLWEEPVYQWNDDNTHATASRICSRDGSHTETETVKTVISILQEPSCEESGLADYAATFENEAFTELYKEDVVLPPLGHDWSDAVYTWSDGNSSVTAERICVRNPDHIRTAESAEITDYISKSPAADEAGIRLFTATFEDGLFDRTEKEETIPALKDMDVMYLPAQAVIVDEEALAGTACEAVILPDGCGSIESGAFAACAYLRYAWIPESVGYIAEDAFGENVLLDYEADHSIPVLRISTDASGYSFSQTVVLTASVVCRGSAADLSEQYPEVIFTAVLLTAEGDAVPGYSEQASSGPDFTCSFLLDAEDLAPGLYKIYVETNIPGLNGTSRIFRYAGKNENIQGR